jgi:hypothetical protein
MLVENEMDICDEETKTKKALIVKSSTKLSKYGCQRSDLHTAEGSSIKYHLCDADYAFRFCNHVKLAGKLLK